MKYIYLPQVFTLLLILFYTFCELVVLSIVYVLMFLWDFKFPRHFWSWIHSDDGLTFNEPYCDHNIIETIIRRYSWFWGSVKEQNNKEDNDD